MALLSLSKSLFLIVMFSASLDVKIITPVELTPMRVLFSIFTFDFTVLIPFADSVYIVLFAITAFSPVFNMESEPTDRHVLFAITLFLPVFLMATTFPSSFQSKTSVCSVDMLLFDTVMPEPEVRIAAGPPMLDIVLL